MFILSGLDKGLLKRMWDMVAGNAGALNAEQFFKCMYIMDGCRRGAQLPAVLPPGVWPQVGGVPVALLLMYSCWGHRPLVPGNLLVGCLDTCMAGCIEGCVVKDLSCPVSAAVGTSSVSKCFLCDSRAKLVYGVWTWIVSRYLSAACAAARHVARAADCGCNAMGSDCKLLGAVDHRNAHRGCAWGGARMCT